MALPGRYYFITLTSADDSPRDMKLAYLSFLRWVKKYRPGCQVIKVITNEGNGVIHAILRLKRNQKMVEATDLRAFWKRRHRAVEVRIVPVRDYAGLLRYISEQEKKGLSFEMAGQVQITSVGRTHGWIPSGFVPAFKRFWFFHASRGVPTEYLSFLVTEWIRECHREGIVTGPPEVVWTPDTIPGAACPPGASEGCTSVQDPRASPGGP